MMISISLLHSVMESVQEVKIVGQFRHTQLVRVATRCAVEVFPKQCEFRELIEEDFLAKWLPVRNPLYILYIYTTTLLINNLMFRADGQGSGHISGPEHHRLLHCHNCTGCGECWSAGWSTRCAGQDRHADKHNGVTHYNAHHTRQCHHARWRRHYSQWRHYTRWRHYTQWGHYSRCWNYSRRWHYGQPNHSQPNHTRFDERNSRLPHITHRSARSRKRKFSTISLCVQTAVKAAIPPIRLTHTLSHSRLSCYWGFATLPRYFWILSWLCGQFERRARRIQYLKKS